jgi:hypothetical protein
VGRERAGAACHRLEGGYLRVRERTKHFFGHESSKLLASIALGAQCRRYVGHEWASTGDGAERASASKVTQTRSSAMGLVSLCESRRIAVARLDPRRRGRVTPNFAGECLVTAASRGAAFAALANVHMANGSRMASSRSSGEEFQKMLFRASERTDGVGFEPTVRF